MTGISGYQLGLMVYRTYFLVLGLQCGVDKSDRGRQVPTTTDIRYHIIYAFRTCSLFKISITAELPCFLLFTAVY
ncbi:hypothetical protein I7I50_09664 [Histoplasma capsulatum G186AR]|uniref:Uncharacterized protein n=1 Tax=Ajellomyces capsulatus TaxID=5037 RepID=A0A8H7YRM6_AJECA|nr:hypothetical protein I7I52_07194 [Histoplasma capsulatum]QSS74465.1 hypothetical protein I7I50_09664 [Histoplasma capsulatum G186AR]